MQGTGAPRGERRRSGLIRGQNGPVNIMERLRGGGATTNDPTAVARRRFVAWILDSLFMAIIILVIHRSGVAFLDEAGNLAINPSVIWTATLLMVLNQVGLTMATGFSLGKAVAGLRVVNRYDGGLPGFRGAAGRTLPWVVPIPFIPFIEAGLILASTGHRRIGDRIGATLVVDRGWAGQPFFVPGLDEVPGDEQIPGDDLV